MRTALSYNAGKAGALPAAAGTPGVGASVQKSTQSTTQPNPSAQAPATPVGPKPIGYALREIEGGKFKGVSGFGENEQFHTFANAEEASAFYHPKPPGGTLATATPVPPPPPPGVATTTEKMAAATDAGASALAATGALSSPFGQFDLNNSLESATKQPGPAPAGSSSPPPVAAVSWKSRAPVPTTPASSWNSPGLAPVASPSVAPAVAPAPAPAAVAVPPTPAPTPTPALGATGDESETAQTAPDDEDDPMKVANLTSVFGSPSGSIAARNKRIDQSRPSGFQADALYA